MKDLFVGKAMIYKCLAVLTVFSLFLLPACLGGGSGNGNVIGPGGSVNPPQGGNDPDPGVADIRDEFLVAVNQARSASRICGNTPYGPAPPVSWSDSLAMAAYLHSEDMALNNFFSHTGSDGSSAGQRISRQGYSWRAYGENIAVGNQTVSSVLQGWLGSEGHCRNLMDPAFTEVGAGYAIGPFGGNLAARYWTLDLADR
ncbi:MAG: CAP domain-containing protein [Deltaproteobacteria bacterium]|nr:CAP domain-containing protein [Deltaproteobacteria bacterium]